MRLLPKFPVRKPVGMGPVNELERRFNVREFPVFDAKPALKIESGRLPDRLLLDKSNVKLPSGSADLNSEFGSSARSRLFARLIFRVRMRPGRTN